MAGFWDSATEGFNKGVPLGVRAAERSKEDERLNRQENRLDKQEERSGMQLQANLQEASDRQYERTQRLGMETESHEKTMQAEDLRLEEADRKQRQDKFRTAYVVAKALAEDGKERPAAGIIGQAYNKLVKDGNETIIIAKADKPDDPKWKDVPEDTQYLVGSPQFGVSPHKSIKDVLKVLEPYALDPEKFMEHERQAKTAVDDKNAAEKPFRGADNKLYVKKWSLSNDSKKTDVVPYEGPEPMNSEEEKVRGILNIPDKLLSKEGKKVVLGLREKEKSPDPDKGAVTPKDIADLTGKQRDQFKKDLDLVLKPFSAGGKPVLDTETGEITVSGQNALDAAGKLITKYEKSSDTLTPDEKRNVQHAYRAWEIYKKISGTVSSGYVKQTEGGWKQYDTTPKKQEPKRSESTRGF
jgi:hypothetical protein